MTIILKKRVSRDEIDEQLKQVNKSRQPRHNFGKYVGAVNIPGDPLEIQKKLRDEWE